MTADDPTYERKKFESLVEEAKAMTALGLEGEDIREHRTAAFVHTLKKYAATPADAFKFSAHHWPHFKRTGQLRTD